MMASAAVLAAQHFPHKVDNWEGLPSTSRMWTAWKTAFCLAHVKRQQQILASGGGGASWQGSWCDPGGGAGNWASQNHTQQPGSCRDERYRGPPAAHCCQLGPHGHHHVAHSNDSGWGWYSGSDSGGDSGGNSSEYSCDEETLPRELLLDSRPSREQAPHKCNLRQQSFWPPRRRDGLQHLWRQQQGQELECGAHLTGWDG